MGVVADWWKVQCKAKVKLRTILLSRFWQKPPKGSIDIRSEADFSKSAWNIRLDAVYIFLPDYFYPYKNVIACANVFLTTNFFRLTTSLKLSLGQENIKCAPHCQQCGCGPAIGPKKQTALCRLLMLFGRIIRSYFNLWTWCYRSKFSKSVVPAVINTHQVYGFAVNLRTGSAYADRFGAQAISSKQKAPDW